jgi:hypothetical protein
MKMPAVIGVPVEAGIWFARIDIAR